MADPFSGGQTTSAPYSSDPFIAGLLLGDFRRWGDGSETTLTYSFPWTTSDTAQWGANYGNGELDADLYFGFNNVQMAAVDMAFSEWSKVIDVDFVKVFETVGFVGDLRFAFTTMEKDTWGWAYHPNDYWPSGGDIWINSAKAGEADWSKSSYNFFALMHEIGHALGLEHPFKDSDGDVYSLAYDTRAHTIMSYTSPENVRAWDSTTGQSVWTIQSPMIYDILAAQHLYGPNWAYNSGDNVYAFNPEEAVHKTVWDGGGQDTFDFSRFARDIFVNLTPGFYSDIPAVGWDATGNIGIAFGAVIENVIGGAGNDYLVGNSVDNKLSGGAGNDRLTGGDGADIFSFAGSFGADIITDFDKDADALEWLDADGAFIKGIGSFVNVERTSNGDAKITVSHAGILGNITLLGVTPEAIADMFSTFGQAIVDTSVGSVLKGTSGSDLIQAQGGDDIIMGSQGDDVLDGGSGYDTVIYSGNQASYTFILSPTATRLTDRRFEGNGTDDLIDVEMLNFETAFDLTMFGGMAKLSGQQLKSFVELYIAYFNRAPDALGLNFWGTAYAKGTTLEEIATLFVDQDESRAAYPGGTTHEDFATTVYSNVLGRIPDGAGFDFWVKHLNSGAVSRDQFILEVLRGVEPGTSDRDYLDAKVDVGAYFAVHKGMSDTSNASAVLALFDDIGVEAAIAAVDGHYAEAQDPVTGEFLMPVIGVLHDPFLV